MAVSSFSCAERQGGRQFIAWKGAKETQSSKNRSYPEDKVRGEKREGQLKPHQRERIPGPSVTNQMLTQLEFIQVPLFPQLVEQRVPFFRVDSKTFIFIKAVSWTSSIQFYMQSSFAAVWRLEIELMQDSFSTLFQSRSLASQFSLWAANPDLDHSPRRMQPLCSSGVILQYVLTGLYMRCFFQVGMSISLYR